MPTSRAGTSTNASNEIDELANRAVLSMPGERLPAGTRFCRATGDIAGWLPSGNVVAFVPCQQFESDGPYLIAGDDAFRVVTCRASKRDSKVHMTAEQGTTTITRHEFSQIVEGRVIGIIAVPLAER
jgi:hypothetical protein